MLVSSKDVSLKKNTLLPPLIDQTNGRYIYEYSADVYKKLGDAILWTTILAAVHKDGVIEEEERAEAIKQTHIRSFSTEPYIKPIYEHLDEHFEKDFDTYIKDLPVEYEAKEAYIQAKLADCVAILKDMGPVFYG